MIQSFLDLQDTFNSPMGKLNGYAIPLLQYMIYLKK